jgi:hypothetical protein
MTVLSLIFGFTIGIILMNIYSRVTNSLNSKKLIKKQNEYYKIIFDKVSERKSRFVTRVNDVVYIKLLLNDEYGKVDLVYSIKDSDLNIMKDGNVIITSEYVDNDLLQDCINVIIERHENKINDIVYFMNIVMYRPEFERMIGMSVIELQKRIDILSGNETEIKPINKKIKINTKEEIDRILDKINQFGIETLTPEELEFLNSQSK